MQKHENRIVLKLSGTAFVSDNKPVDIEMVESIAQKISALCDIGFKIAVVVGAGNIWRGGRTDSNRLERIDSDTIGMIATTVNASALHFSCKKRGIKSYLMSTFAQLPFIDEYYPQKANACFDRHDVIVIAGGIGRPFFSTDTCSALCASETGSPIILKASNVAGFYDKDPALYSDAKIIKNVSFKDVIGKTSVLFDESALLICMSNNIKIKIFDLREDNSFVRALTCDDFGSCIKP